MITSVTLMAGGYCGNRASYLPDAPNGQSIKRDGFILIVTMSPVSAQL